MYPVYINKENDCGVRVFFTYNWCKVLAQKNAYEGERNSQRCLWAILLGEKVDLASHLRVIRKWDKKKLQKYTNGRKIRKGRETGREQETTTTRRKNTVSYETVDQLSRAGFFSYCFSLNQLHKIYLVFAFKI